jgi:hypothetical protein
MIRYGKCNDRENFTKLFNESSSISELGRKLGYKSKNNAIPGGVSKIIRAKVEEYKLDISRIKGQGWSKGFTKYNNNSINKISLKKALPWDDCFRDGSTIRNQSLLKRLIDSGKRKYVCEECGLSKWKDKDIVLEIHHINEKFNDNREENLKILCPNCHSILGIGKYSILLNFISPKHLKEQETTNYGNYKIDKVEISNNELADLVSRLNIIEVGKILNISGKSVMKLCKIRNIQILNKSFLQKKFSVEKDKMIELLKTNSILQIGKIFGVSDNAIRKRCKTMGVEWKKRISNGEMSELEAPLKEMT